MARVVLCLESWKDIKAIQHAILNPHDDKSQDERNLLKQI
jgi:hypothetical protein